MTIRSTLTALALSAALVGVSAAGAFAHPITIHPVFPVWGGPVHVYYHPHKHYDTNYFIWWWWHFHHTHHWHPYIIAP